MPLNLFQVFLPQQLHILRRHEAALAGDGIEKALPFQLLIGPLGGDDADTQILGQVPDGGQRVILPQRSADDLVLDLGVDLLVNGSTAFVVNE